MLKDNKQIIHPNIYKLTALPYKNILDSIKSKKNNNLSLLQNAISIFLLSYK
jgi:hypothetical protein